MTNTEPQESRDQAGARPDRARAPLIVNPHRKLPVWLWVIPLVIVVAAIVLLPHVLERFL